MKTVITILLALTFNNAMAADCPVEQGEKEATACMLEQAQVDAALKEFKPQGRNDIRLFSIYFSNL